MGNIQKRKNVMPLNLSLNMELEQQQGFCKYHVEHYSDGVENTIYTSDSVHHGFVNGLKDEEKEKSSGQDEGIIKTMRCHHLKRVLAEKR